MPFYVAVTTLISFKYLSRNVHRGFICGDPSLSLSRKPDTVTNVMLVAWGLSPLLIVGLHNEVNGLLIKINLIPVVCLRNVLQLREV